MFFTHLNHIQLLRYAGLLTYACAGIPLLSESWRPAEISSGSFEVIYWRIAFIAFGWAYWFATRDMGRRRDLRVKIALLLMMDATALAVGYISHSGMAGILMMLIAGVVPWMLPLWIGVIWVVVQNLTLIPNFAGLENYSLLDAILQGGLYTGFSAFTFVTSLVARQQADSREEQRRLNSELRATRTLLAESSRIAERMRISRELHDLVGHHLTALSLNLEVASHLVSGQAQEHVRQAQSVARLLLSDVREVVSQLREDDAIDLTEALRTLIEGIPGLDVSLELPPRFAVDDPRRAQVLLRCAQEIITNTVRHSGARHLRLRFERTEDNELAIHARDDGRGATELKQGNGLAGMRERLAQLGGRLTIETGKDQGFALDAWLPLEATQ